MTTVKITLSDSEWMSLLDAERDGLPRCCANVSALRDVVQSIVRDGCEVTGLTSHQLEIKFVWFLEGHDLDEDGALAKLARQVGLPMEPPEEHPKQPVEV